MQKFLHRRIAVVAAALVAAVVSMGQQFGEVPFENYIARLPQATTPSPTDSTYILQQGVSKQISSATLIGATSRLKLTANLDLYFDFVNGNDSRSCLTPATACKTIQSTFQTFLATYDTAGFQTTIHAITTDTAGLVIRSSWVGGGVVTIAGPTGASPATVGIDTSLIGFPAIILAAPNPGPLVLSNIYLSGSIGLDVLASSLLLIDPGVNFGPATVAHIVVNNAGASINCATGGVTPPFVYTISGSAPIHYDAESGFISCPNYTVNLVGNPNFSTAFAKATNSGSALNLTTWSFTGSATGPKYLAALNASIATGTTINCAASPAYLPGNAPGTCMTGGQVQ